MAAKIAKVIVVDKSGDKKEYSGFIKVHAEPTPNITKNQYVFRSHSLFNYSNTKSRR